MSNLPTGFFRQDGVQLSPSEKIYFYNPGSQITPVKIDFVLPKTSITYKDDYIAIPCNSYVKSSDGKDYSYFSINDKIVFRFITPPSFSSFNKGVEIIKKYNVGDSILDLQKELRTEVYHYYVRAWIMAVITAFLNDSTRTYCSVEGALKDGWQDKMLYLFSDFCVGTEKWESTTDKPIFFSFNSSNGEAIMNITYRSAKPDYSLANQVYDIKTVEENVGNMVIGNYIKIEGGNRPNTNGFITINDCSYFTSSIPISGFKMVYDSYYL